MPRRSIAHSSGAAESYQAVEKSQAPIALSAPLHKSLLWSLMGGLACVDHCLGHYLSISDTSPKAPWPLSNYTTTQSAQLLGSLSSPLRKNQTLSSLGNKIGFFSSGEHTGVSQLARQGSPVLRTQSHWLSPSRTEKFEKSLPDTVLVLNSRNFTTSGLKKVNVSFPRPLRSQGGASGWRRQGLLGTIL